ncbi:MAG: HAD family hydrolase [Acidobacteria bacterium]|uniref:HAD family hydrolase n=1 Tax=Candidatus Polarisedimenticola svalbardensis TaxID=2886004 RepID=A0A8J7CD15_9BACT|nr:HAD family hydrolase [Candidatus Polarisedimenticola svalbardensis]
MSGRYGTILLDAGGVLLDLDYGRLASMLEERGCSSTPGELSRFEALARVEIENKVRSGGRTGDAWRGYFFTILKEAGLAREQHAALVDELWALHHRQGLWVDPIPGAVVTVRKLREEGYRLAVVSNAEGRVEQDLDAAGYEGLFETVVDSHRVGVEKPDPAIFAIALDRLGVKASTAMFAGDVPAVDVAGARRAGIAPVLVDRHDLFQDVDAPRIRSIADLPDWLES